MRPRRRILLVDSNDASLSVRAFFLDNSGFCVIQSSDAYTALNALIGDPEIHLVVIAMSGIDWNGLVWQIKSFGGDIRTILTSETIRSGEVAHGADYFLGKGSCSPFDLLDRVKFLCARKRGPKKVVARVIHQMAS